MVIDTEKKFLALWDIIFIFENSRSFFSQPKDGMLQDEINLVAGIIRLQGYSSLIII